MKVIILAAGQGFELDGYNKILIRDPLTGERIMDHYIRIFKGYDITVVVGYRAINIMNRYPAVRYIYNAQWRLANNSYSLALALDDEPCFVLSSDFIFDPRIVEVMEHAAPNCILTYHRENRILTSLNCAVAKDGRIKEMYQGEVRERTDPEAAGIYKITDRKILRDWKTRCLQHSNLFAGQNLDFITFPIFSVDKGDMRFDEINTPLDYMELLKRCPREKGYKR